MLSYSQDELVGIHFNSITHPDDLMIGADAVLQMKNGKTGKVVFEKRYLKKSGEIIWVHINSTLLRDENNNPNYFITQIEDITPRFEKDLALKASENKFKALVEQSLTGIYIFEEDKYIYVNSRFCEIFGYSENEIMTGMRPTDVISTEDKNRADENIKKRLSGEVQSVRYVAKGNHKSGKPLWVEIHGTHLEIEGKDVIAGTILDITDRKIAEEEIRKLNEELEEKVKDRTNELEIKISEIQRMNKLFVGRELRMKELKEKLKEIENSQRDKTNN
jgi:PAS domain S-box-containing protein